MKADGGTQKGWTFGSHRRKSAFLPVDTGTKSYSRPNCIVQDKEMQTRDCRQACTPCLYRVIMNVGAASAAISDGRPGVLESKT